MDNLQAEVEKLRAIRNLEIGPYVFESLPWKVLQVLKRRAMSETASGMRDHTEMIQYGLIGCFLHIRATEVTDDITPMAVELIHRLDKRSEKQIQKEWLANLEPVEGKMQILSRVAEAVVGEPDGVVRNVIFLGSRKKPSLIWCRKFRLESPQLRLLRQTVIRRHIRLHAEHFPTGEEIPLDGIVSPRWREKVLGEGEDEKFGSKVRMPFETESGSALRLER